MNKTIFSAFIAAILFLTVSCSQENKPNTTVTIYIENVNTGLLTFQQRGETNWIKIDSVELVEGKAVYTTDMDLPEFFYLSLEGQRNYIPVFVEQGEINVTTDIASLGKPTVTGSKSNSLYESFMSTLTEFDNLYKPLSEQYQQARAEKDEELMENIVAEFDDLDKQKNAYILNFAVKNNSSVVSPFAIMNYSYMFELEDLEKVSDALDPAISNSVYTKSLNDRIAVLQRVAIGQPLVDFTMNDPDGNPISIVEAVKGKYTLVDFWASWCGPCRRENPNVVKAYNNFHEKGFDIFGISFDQNHNAWVKAIKDDKLTWTHVSDLKYWSSEAGKLYGVKSIPHSILVDPDGIIIAKNLRGEDLQLKLAELLN